jgi:4-amino-4-deoxy-L-arabinose transferase-like glycosyltransferase
VNYTSLVQVEPWDVRSRDNGDLQPRSPSVRVSSRLIAYRDRLETVPIHLRMVSLILLSLTLIYFLLTAPSAYRLLWHDELFTYYIANAPTMARFWQELRLDLNPPLEYLAVRMSMHMFGQSEYATRLPSILAFLMGSLCFYRFIADRLNSAYGTLATILVWATPFFSYATEARPYALVIGFFGLTLLAWDRTTSPDRTISWVLLLWLAITGMMLSHVFALLYVIPFCLAQLWIEIRRKQMDLLVWIALLVPCCLPFIYVSTLRGYAGNEFPSAFQASIFKVSAFIMRA